ncbi:hypothetical protein FGRMN_1154 [Fusarium graminum]|nr:hypothetical protein FGRMN_1154 [Fusarium graminum]
MTSNENRNAGKMDHFIGDAHWQGGDDLEPGDEFQLDRGSAIVQVSDRTGQREQDLTELLDKRAKEVEKRRTNAGTRTPGSSAAVAQTPRNDQNAPHFQLRHRPLNDLVGGPSRIGRAVISPHSPYDVRKMAESPGQQQDSLSEEARPSKRRRHEDSPPSKMGHARALFGTPLTLTPFSSSIPLARSQTLREKNTAGPTVTSTGLRDGPSRVLQRANRGSKSPPSSPPTPKPKETETVASAPRRTLTQRASLKELLAGNEHNRIGEHPQPREVVARNRVTNSKQARHQLSHTEDNVISLLSQEQKPQKPRVDTAPRVFRNAKPNQEQGADNSTSSRTSTRKVVETVDSNRDEQQPEDPDEEAFLCWLAQSEAAASAQQTSESFTNPRPGPSKRLNSDTLSKAKKSVQKTQQKAVREPTEKAGDEEIRPAQRQKASPKSLRSKVVDISESHGKKRALVIDRPPVTETDADNPPPAKEPRTELRIRSRQRRGLLMVAQNKQGKRAESTVRSLPSSSGAGSDALVTPPPITEKTPTLKETEAAQKIVEETNMPQKVRKRQNPSISNDYTTSEHEPDNAQPAQGPASNRIEEYRSTILHGDPHKITNRDLNKGSSEGFVLIQQPDDECGPNGNASSDNNLDDRASVTSPRRRTNPSRRGRPKAAQVVLSDEEDEAGVDGSLPKSDIEDGNLSTESEAGRKLEPKPSAGPKITKMSRKSVKSKEIIGFIMPPDDFPTAGFNVGHIQRAEIETPNDSTLTVAPPSDGVKNVSNDPGNASNDSNNFQSILCQPETVQTPINEDKSQPKQPARIVNPATRGRKAARKQDAAGLPPQALVQLDSRVESPVVPAMQPKKTTPAANVPQSELPVFCRANGGAWSRHAEDLLGIKRPSRRPSRR